jgi:hypothetical protein
MWGTFSDETTGLSFIIAAGARQRSHSRARGQWDSRPYFAVSDSRLPFSSPPTTLRATVEVFDPASSRETELTTSGLATYSRLMDQRTENTASLLLRDALLGLPRDRYLSSPLALWLQPNNRTHSSYCCSHVFRAWPRNGRPFIVACKWAARCLSSRFLVVLWANPSQ